MAQKKAKVSPKVLTFGLSYSPVRVQLLSSHTVHDLCDTFCQHTTIGGGESVYSHMWNVEVHATGRCYESGVMECMSPLRAEQTKLDDLELPGPNAKLSWMYDYGSTCYYNVTLLDEATLGDDESEAESDESETHSQVERREQRELEEELWGPDPNGLFDDCDGRAYDRNESAGEEES